jgi:hypothetical protein
MNHLNPTVYVTTTGVPLVSKYGVFSTQRVMCLEAPQTKERFVVLSFLGILEASFLVVNRRFGKACLSHYQGINNLHPDDVAVKPSRNVG